MAAGMVEGLVADLAVGVSPEGADAWALQDDLALGVSVGAPPDLMNALGQDWRQPPLRPDRLQTTAYAPFREIVRHAVRHAGGLRVDHVAGLFRQWWVPADAAPDQGTYVAMPSGRAAGRAGRGGGRCRRVRGRRGPRQRPQRRPSGDWPSGGSSATASCGSSATRQAGASLPASTLGSRW